MIFIYKSLTTTLLRNTQEGNSMARKKATTKRKTTASKTKARKTTGRKKTAAKRQPASRKAAATKKTARKPALKVGKTPFKKSEIYSYISDRTELNKKEVVAVFDSLNEVIHSHLKKSGPGEFTLPGLLKIKVHHKPARKARKGINPFTGEEMMFKAKKASKVAKIRPLKKLKEMVD